jgi:hypothetical protein
MTRVVKTNQGDYHVLVQNGGTIILDPTSSGQVTVTGNLVVNGTTTTINSSTLNVEVNVLQINAGLTTNGIPSALSYQSGLQIDRGVAQAAELLFDESVRHYDPTTAITATGYTATGSAVTFNFSTQSSVPFPVASNGSTGSTIVVAGFTPSTYNGTYTVTACTTSSVTFASAVTGTITTLGTITLNKGGTFKLQTADGSLSGLELRTITSDGNNTLIIDMQRGAPTLRLANSTTAAGVPYYQRVLSGDDIPNVQWVQTYIASNYTLGSSTPGTATVQTIQQPVGVAIGSANSAIQATSSGLLFQIAGSTVVTINSTGAVLGNLSVGSTANPNTISNSTNANLILTTQSSTYPVEINAVAQLDNQASTPTYTSGGTKLYSSATIGPGRTGLYLVNSTVQTADELISRNRAVLLSILL